MYVGRDFDASDPEENEPYSFDFQNDVPPGETITSAVWTCEVADDSAGDDEQAATRLSGAPTNSGVITTHSVAGLQAGVKYLLQAVVTTNEGNVVSLWSHVLGRDPG